MKFLLLITLFLAHFLSAQDDNKSKVLQSKEQMMASATFGKSPMNFMKKEFRVGNFTNIGYNSQWLQFNFGYGDVKIFNDDNSIDTVQLKEFAIGTSFPIKKLAFGHRLFDINGFLIIPLLNSQLHWQNARENKAFGAKITPTLSLQLPYFGIDLKINTFFNFKNEINGLKNFGFTPEIALKFDGLYNLLDAQRVYIGHAEGTQSFRRTSYSTETKRDGDFIITTTYKTEYTEVIPYSFDRYATLIGPMVAIGAYHTFQNRPYAGTTKLFGLAYHLRLGILSSDLMLDAGTIGFGDELKEASTFQEPEPKYFVGLNKEKNRNIGQYKTQRAQIRLGVDLYEIYLGTLGQDAAVENSQGKFTRFIGGLGFGYAFINDYKYNLSNGEAIADEIFENNSDLLSVSANHAKFADDGAFMNLFFSLEAGALRLTFEANRYFNANLANTKSVTVGYMFPYNRIKKKMYVIKTLKK